MRSVLMSIIIGSLFLIAGCASAGEHNQLADGLTDGEHYTAALQKLDPEICNQINDSSIRNDCLIKANSAVAFENICNQESGSAKDECVLSTSIAIGESSFCEKISDVRLKNSCKVEVPKANIEISKCRQLGKVRSAPCIAEVAADFNAPFVCSLVEEEAVCFGGLAALTKDPGICDNLRTETLHSDCIKNYMYYALNADQVVSEKLCEGLTGEDKDYCLLSVYSVGLDPDDCLNLVGKSKDECLESVFGNLGYYDKFICNDVAPDMKEVCFEGFMEHASLDTATCDRMGSEYQKQCYDYLVEDGDVDDLNLCVSITSSAAKRECINNYFLTVDYGEFEDCDILGDFTAACYEIAYDWLDVHDEKDCEMMGKQTIKDDCYDDLAYETEDVQYCSKIQDAALKEECIDYI